MVGFALPLLSSKGCSSWAWREPFPLVLACPLRDLRLIGVEDWIEDIAVKGACMEVGRGPAMARK